MHIGQGFEKGKNDTATEFALNVKPCDVCREPCMMALHPGFMPTLSSALLHCGPSQNKARQAMEMTTPVVSQRTGGQAMEMTTPVITSRQGQGTAMEMTTPVISSKVQTDTKNPRI